MPVTGSIMPPFTLALYGPDAVARLMRGFVVGLTGFGAFFFVVAACAVSLGITAAFVAAALLRPSLQCDFVSPTDNPVRAVGAG